MEVDTINLFGNFAYKFSGDIYHQKIGRPTGTQAATIAAMISMEETLEDMKEEADKPKSAVHNIGDMVYLYDGGFFSGQERDIRTGNSS